MNNEHMDTNIILYIHPQGFLPSVYVHGDGGEELHGGDEVGDGVVPQGEGQVREAQPLVEAEDEAELYKIVFWCFFCLMFGD